MSAPERATSHAWCVLGSNQGDRAAMLRRAAFLLAAAPGIRLGAAARIYETPPWGDTFQGAFLNTAVELVTRLEPEALLDVFQDIERRLGRPPRERRERWGPRGIDLDLALYDNRSIHTGRLTVPHPRLAERAFALLPLLEIAPDARDPQTGRPFRDDLAALAVDAARCRPVEPLIVSGDAACRAIESFAASGIAAASDAVLVRSASPEETERAAEVFGRALAGGEIVALAGNLGAGKTCLTRGIARGLDIDEPITSPSYVLVKSYEGRLVLHHADFYRLAIADETPTPAPHSPRKAELDLATLGLDDYIDDPEAVLAIEWADRFPAWLEPPFYLAELHGAGAQPRLILLRRAR